MKILSLFDGISCARVALERAGIPVEAYYASEVDKYAIQISTKNYPDIKQMGSVIGINTKVLCLSGVYDILKSYDTNIQNYFSEQEMLYWLNQNFSISAKIRTQISNGNTSESTSIQRIEEIWFSKSGMENIIKTQYLIPSRTIRENGNLEAQELLLQCGEWGYVCRIDTGNKAENIQWNDGKKIKTRKHRENQTICNQTVQQSPITNTTIRTDQERNVETKKSSEVFGGIEKQKEWRTKKTDNRIQEARSVVQEIGEFISKWDEDDRTPKSERNILSIHKEMETTVVKTNTTIDIFTGTFEIMCGGSPCQDLSIAKSKTRKGLDGDKSSLFYEYVRILREVKPKWFILENVVSMSDESRDIISQELGVQPIELNAKDFSAQNRARYFWTNIPVTQPETKSTQVIEDILQVEVEEKYYYKDFPFTIKDETKNVIGTIEVTGHDILKRIYNRNSKSATVTTCAGGNTQHKILDNGRVRKLTPIEYEALQGLPRDYTAGISDSQRYKCLGNAFNVDVVAHILSFIK